MKKRFISAKDLTRDEVQKIFDLAKELKARPEDFRHHLEGQMFGLIFEKPSTRTWIS